MVSPSGDAREKRGWSLFVDMDGVLADFDQHHETIFGVRADKLADNVDWKAVRASKDFYLNIPPMADMPALWDFVARFNPTVLTGVPSSVEEAPENKRAWARKHLGSDVKVITCLSKEKCLHAQPGDILIDDWTKHRALWLAKGGRWITHKSAERSIDALLDMGVGL